MLAFGFKKSSSLFKFAVSFFVVEDSLASVADCGPKPCVLFRCVELVHEEMQRIIQHCGNEVQQEMLRFL